MEGWPKVERAPKIPAVKDSNPGVRRRFKVVKDSAHGADLGDTNKYKLASQSESAPLAFSRSPGELGQEDVPVVRRGMKSLVGIDLCTGDLARPLIRSSRSSAAIFAIRSAGSGMVEMPTAES